MKTHPQKNRAIQSAQLDLERQQASDSLRKGLEKRPEREELIERTEYTFAPFFSIQPTPNPVRSTKPAGWLGWLVGCFPRKYLKTDIVHLIDFGVFFCILGNILPDSNAAPAIQGQQRELQKHMRADSLEQKLLQRPKAEELMKEGILDEDPTSPAKE